jgi:hypothetical protein
VLRLLQSQTQTHPHRTTRTGRIRDTSRLKPTLHDLGSSTIPPGQPHVIWRRVGTHDVLREP